MDNYNVFFEDQANADKQLEDFKKRYNYDNKAKTIVSNGQKIPFRHIKGNPDKQERNASFCRLSKLNKRKRASRYAHDAKSMRSEYNAISDMKPEIKVNTAMFDTNAKNVDNTVNHEFGHVKDFSLKRKLDNDRESIIYKYNSGTDLSKLPKEIRKKRLELLNDDKAIENEESFKEYTKKREKFYKKRNKFYNKDLTKFINDSDDEMAKKHIAYKKLKNEAIKQTDKRWRLLNAHDKGENEVLADASAIRNGNKNINKAAREMRKTLNDHYIDNTKKSIRKTYNSNKNTNGNLVDKVKAVARTVRPAIRDVKELREDMISNRARMKNAKKVAKMPESKILESMGLTYDDMYDIIVESLEEQVLRGEITLEFAEAVNDLAYERLLN